MHWLGRTMMLLITSGSMWLVAEEFPGGGLQPGVLIGLIRGSPQHGPTRLAVLVLLLMLVWRPGLRRWANRHSTAPEPHGPRHCPRGFLVAVVSTIIVTTIHIVTIIMTIIIIQL